MDDFRRIQRKECKDGGGGGGCYGCGCCRKPGNLNKFKKYVRRTARKTLKNQDLREE